MGKKLMIMIVSLVFFISCKKGGGEGQKQKINEAIVSFVALPGDGFVYLQWEYISDTSSLRMGTCMLLPFFRVYRAEKGKEFKELTYTIDKKDYIRWAPYPGETKHSNAKDTTVKNGVTYLYYIKVEWLTEEVPCPFYSVSDTLEVRPEAELPDPIPPAPDSVWIERNDSLHTFTLYWIPPPNNDSLYYLVENLSGPFYEGFTFDDLTGWFPALDEHEYTDGIGYFPEPYYTFPDAGEYLQPDKPDTVWYYIIAIVDGILSYPSKIVKAVHID